MSFINDIRIYLKGNNRAVAIFMIINISVFLVVNILINLVKLGGGRDEAELIMRELICLQGNLGEFATHFWTLGTYMFAHGSIMHLLGNMLWLFFLGRIFCELLGSKRMFNVYLLGGLAGGVLYLIISQFIAGGTHSYLLGASGSVMAVVVGVATYSPDYRVFPFGIPMKLKWLALISFILTTLLDLSENTGGKAAHIGGALFGLVWAYSLKKGNPFAGAFQRKPKLNVVHKKTVSDYEFNQQKVSVRKRVDEILDKISRSGYDSLSKDEKEFLQKNHDKF
jgi:membrane associated rhomboid family serine protease